MDIWCEVSKEKLVNNLKQIKNVTQKKVVSVVKGNAYGLGLKEVTKILEPEVDIYGVSSLEEADLIDTNKDILIMTPVCEIPTEPKSNYIYTIDNINDLNKFSLNKKYRVHIYLDTGMNRLGILPESIDDLILNITNNYKNIVLEGIYTHLHKANDIEYSKKQIDVLRNIYEKHKKYIKNVHCLNSRGLSNSVLRNYAEFTNLVRAGNALYGYDGKNIGLEKVFQVKARVIKTYTVAKDGYIGYGAKYKVKKDTVVGLFHCGSIEKLGFSRNIKTNILKDCLKTIKNNLHKTSYMNFNGKAIYELCSPNMNCVLVDLTNIPLEEDMYLNLNVSSIQLDSSVQKIYISKH